MQKESSNSRRNSCFALYDGTVVLCTIISTKRDGWVVSNVRMKKDGKSVSVEDNFFVNSDAVKVHFTVLDKDK